MKPLGTIVALIALLAVLFAPAIAQKQTGSPSPGPEEEMMKQMMTMMGQMEKQMGQMQEQMKGHAGHGLHAGPHGADERLDGADADDDAAASRSDARALPRRHGPRRAEEGRVGGNHEGQ
jgi:type II secretory pathway component PulJ